MDASGSYISMPVIRPDSDRNDDERSKQEKQKQVERRLPRMRSGEKQKSEKMLSDAMNIDLKKVATPVPKQFPKPAPVVIKQSQAENEVEHVHEDHDQRMTSDDLGDLHDRHDFNDLHDLEDRLFDRERRLEITDVMPVLKSLLKKTFKPDFSGSKNAIEKNYQDEMLCSLDFIEGYLAVSDSAEATQAELTEIIGALRQKIMNQPIASGSNVNVQQEGLVQLISNSNIRFSAGQNSTGHQQRVIEVSEEVVQDVVSSTDSANPAKDKPRDDRRPGEDSLPLIVQRSI